MNSPGGKEDDAEDREGDPQLIMKVLNNTERMGGLEKSIKALFNRNVKGPLPNLNNKKLDIQENTQKKIQKYSKQEGLLPP